MSSQPDSPILDSTRASASQKRRDREKANIDKSSRLDKVLSSELGLDLIEGSQFGCPRSSTHPARPKCTRTSRPRKKKTKFDWSRSRPTKHGAAQSLTIMLTRNLSRLLNRETNRNPPAMAANNNNNVVGGPVSYQTSNDYPMPLFQLELRIESNRLLLAVICKARLKSAIVDRLLLQWLLFGLYVNRVQSTLSRAVKFNLYNG